MVANKYFYQNIFLFFQTENDLYKVNAAKTSNRRAINNEKDRNFSR